jgi:hypothetical protein
MQALTQVVIQASMLLAGVSIVALLRARRA